MHDVKPTSTVTTTRESERLHDQAGTLVELLHGDTSYPAGSARPGGRVRRRRADGDAGRPQPGRALHVDRRVGGVAGRGQARARGAGPRTSSSGRPTSSTCRSPRPSFDHVFVCFVLEHLAAPGRGARAPQGRAQAGRDDHRDRGRPRLGLLPPRQRRGARGDPVPGRAAARGRRRLADRPPGLPAAGRARASTTCTSRRGWSTWTAAGRSSSTASPARRSRR